MSDSPRVTAETKTRRAIAKASKVQRRRRVDRVDRVALAEAHRVRAGAIGLLACCTCTYPLEQHATPTRHALDCQAHGMTLSAIEAGRYHHIEWKPSP